MNNLTFEKISKYDRQAEPVTVSIPFARGAFTEDCKLTIHDDDNCLPVQTHPLGFWDDDSIKWLLVHFQPDLPGNASKKLRFSIDEPQSQPAAPPPQATVSVTESNGKVKVDTGPLQFLINENGFLPVSEVVLNNEKMNCLFHGFSILHEKERFTNCSAPITTEVEEQGPLRALITIKGKHSDADGNTLLDFVGRITAYAGKPYIDIEHKFIHKEEPEELKIDEISLRMNTVADYTTSRSALGEGYYGTHIQEGDDTLFSEINAETILYQSNEHFVDSFYGDYWADWRTNTGGVALSVYQAHQNFPVALKTDRKGISAMLHPETSPPLKVMRGMGKTHSIQLHFHGPDKPLEEISARSLQFQLPDRPALDPEWCRRNNPWQELFFPDKLPSKLLTCLNKLHDGRPKALGKIHFGDAPDAIYTDQGRGSGETVFVNNEYDRPHACALFYALTGQRRALDSALVSTRHWLDVDFCHYDPDPLVNGGLRVHSTYHASGGVSPSHLWTEGILDYYFLTGRKEALDTARAIGENILRHRSRPELNNAGSTSVRVNGWALRAMVGLFLGTGEERWKTEAVHIAELFLDWFDDMNGLLAPYTSHSMPRVPFMITLTVNSLARYLLIQDDERIKKLIVDAIDDLLENCLGPDGIFYYKELPSLKRTSPTPHALEALTHAYRITGKIQYLKTGVRQFAAMVESPPRNAGNKKKIDSSGAVLLGEGRACLFAQDYTPLIIFAGEAAKCGLLNWYEYP